MSMENPSYGEWTPPTSESHQQELGDKPSSSVLVSRGNGKVEVWNLTDRVNEKGQRVAESQTPEDTLDQDGEPTFDFVEKALSDRTISLEGQAELAETLASTRRSVGDIALKTTIELTKNQESERISHLEGLFSPIIRPELVKSSGDESGYDHLFSKNDQEYSDGMARIEAEAKANQPTIEAQKEYDRFINDETREVSSDRLKLALSKDGGLREILSKYGLNEASLEAVDALRTENALRYDVGTYLIAKLDRLISGDPANFGDRVVNNGYKRTDAKRLPVDGVTSREYVSYLALAKLDGSFNSDRQTESDGVEYNDKGTPIQGQHRDAANLLI